MVEVYLNPRLLQRLDASDVVQDVLIEANAQLADFACERPIAFYPWLRQLAWRRLVRLHEQHVRADRRSVSREVFSVCDLADKSALRLIEQLAVPSPDPHQKLIKSEFKERVRAALAGLSPHDQEVLILRHLEELKVKEIASILGVEHDTVRARLRRALGRLKRNLEGEERADKD